MRAPQKVPEASACKGSSCCALYHRLISEGIACVWIHEARVGATEQQFGDSGRNWAPSSINVSAAMFAHLCNFQITSSLKYTAERKPVGCLML